MARITSKTLFFTTSPRSPSKMIPEIQLLHEELEGQKWNRGNQILFIDKLVESGLFEGGGYIKDKALSARDRITRAPKALGFVDLTPAVSLTDAGQKLVYGKRPQEVFLRQLLKFQLPSPYHTETAENKGTFYVRPYLEIMRLIHSLGHLTFDELKIYGLQLTDYRKFDYVKNKIVAFREDRKRYAGQQKRWVEGVWNNETIKIYSEQVHRGDFKIRESSELSEKKFIETKKRNARDYADACFRYLRFTGLVSLSYKNKSIRFFSEKIPDVEYILTNVERKPVFVTDTSSYKEHLFSSQEPMLYADSKERIVKSILSISEYERSDLQRYSLNNLKDMYDRISDKRRELIIDREVKEIRSFSLYSEVLNTFDEIVSREVFDAPLMLEYNAWRAMTMLNGGYIKGNFRFDDYGEPLATAPGNVPDIECDYGDFVLAVEVTMQRGQRQYEAEGEPVARHYGQLKKRTKKNTYCLFIAPVVNDATVAHFYALNKTNIRYYGGKSKIIPLDIDNFKKLILAAGNYREKTASAPTPRQVRSFLDAAIEHLWSAETERDWERRIEFCVDRWLAA